MTSVQRRDSGGSLPVSTRTLVVACAREVFAELGYDAPLSRVASRAGLTLEALHSEFPDHESIALAVFAENIAYLEGLADDPDASLRTLLEVIVDQISASMDFIHLVDPGSLADPRLTETNRSIGRMLANKLEQPAAMRDVRRDLTVEDVMLALEMLSALLGQTEPAARPAVAGQAWKLLMSGMHA
ncbi:TetR/AcrR family transcriptional regulator [Nocardia sp. A7]|uniref:TetR/AcrR family transcriptional regulator n=1 Tax=Nocardia sp. A7 TaxID=2789274 RepID=UPI003979E50B